MCICISLHSCSLSLDYVYVADEYGHSHKSKVWRYTVRQLTSPGDPIRRVQGTQMTGDK